VQTERSSRIVTKAENARLRSQPTIQRTDGVLFHSNTLEFYPLRGRPTPFSVEFRAASRVAFRPEQRMAYDSSESSPNVPHECPYSVRLERFLRAAKLPAMVEYVCLIFSTLWPFKSCATVRLVLIAVKYTGQRTHPLLFAEKCSFAVRRTRSQRAALGTDLKRRSEYEEGFS